MNEADKDTTITCQSNSPIMSPRITPLPRLLPHLSKFHSTIQLASPIASTAALSLRNCGFASCVPAKFFSSSTRKFRVRNSFVPIAGAIQFIKKSKLRTSWEFSPNHELLLSHHLHYSFNLTFNKAIVSAFNVLRMALNFL